MKKVIKKVLCIVLSIIIAFSSLSLVTMAADGDVENYYNEQTDRYTQYEIISEANKTCRIIGIDVLGDFGDYVIPSEVNDYNVIEIEKDVFKYVAIESPGVVIPDSVTDFGNMFDENGFIRYIKLGAGFEKFDPELFTGMTALEKITISENHPEYCTVDGVVFDKEMKTLIFYPENKQNYAYAIPDGVTSIGDGAFQNVKNLTKLYIPESVKNVDENTFSNCTALTEIYYKNGTESTNVEYEYESLGNNQIKLTYYKDFSTVVTVPEKIDSYTVVSVAENTFKDCIYATEIVLPATVTEIEKLGAPVLQNFEVPVNAETISSNIFDGCELLKTITVNSDNGFYSVKDNILFSKDETVLVACPDTLENRIVIPDGTVEILDGAFAGFNHKLTVNIPDTVTSIGTESFLNTNVVLFGNSGSYAETYATENSVSFFSLVARVTLSDGTSSEYGLFDAFTVAQDNPDSVVTLLKNTDINTQRKSTTSNKIVYKDKGLDVKKGDFTLDLDDFTLTKGSSTVISVYPFARLTITTNSVNKAGGIYGSVCVSGAGELVINDGFIENDSDAVTVAGNLIVNGGTFISTASDADIWSTGMAISFFSDDSMIMDAVPCLGTGQISGGVFKGGIEIYAMQGSPKISYKDIIAPGYSFYLLNEPDNKIASSSGFSLKKNDVIVDKTRVAVLNDKYYYNMDSAINDAAKSENSTITLLENINMGIKSLKITDGQFDINMNGKTITSKNSDATVIISKDANVRFYDESEKNFITNTNEKAKTTITNYGNLTLDNVNVSGTSVVNDGHSLALKNGTDLDCRLNSSSNLTVTDTTISAFSNAVTIENDGSIDVIFGEGSRINGGLTINNGENNPYSLADITADGYYFYTATGKVENPETKTEIKDCALLYTDAMATVTIDGTVTCYDTLDEALTVAEATPNSTLTLLKDVDLGDQTLKINSGNFTLDINGKTVTSTKKAIFISSKAEIIITDNTGNGKVQGQWGIESDSFSIIENIEIVATGYYGILAETPYYVSEKTLTLKNCNIVSAKYGVYMQSGNISIKDCVITGDTNAMFVAADSNFVESICLENVELNNGIYIDIVPEDGSAGMSKYYLKDTLVEGFAYYDADGNIIKLNSKDVILEGNVSVKAQYEVSGTDKDGNTTYYPTIEDAVEATNDDIYTKLKLLADILRESELNFNGITTLDLNGKTIDSESEYAISVNENATLNIENGEINNTVLIDGGTLNFNSGVINSETDGVHNNGGTFNMYNGEIIAGDGCVDIYVEGDNETNFMGGAYMDGFTVGGTVVNDVLADGYAFYDNYVGVELTDTQTQIDSNVVILEKTIVSAMSSQIRFNMKSDGTYNNTFDVRTRAKISDTDFKKYIATNNTSAAYKISKVGFVYSTAETEFNIDVAKTVAQGGKAEGFVDKPISYIQDADGYYMFTCLVTGIPEEELDNGLTAYAYICIEDTWYFFPVEVTAEFGEMYNTYYPIAAEEYGWEI